MKTYLVALLLLADWFAAMTMPKLVTGRVLPAKEEKCPTKKL
jgi:hypothetical protein